MTHVRQKLALGPCRGLRRILCTTELGVTLAPIGNVSEKGSEKEAAFDAHRGTDGELNRELPPRSMHGGQFEPLIDDWSLSGLVKAPHPADVCLTKCRRDDRLGQNPAENLVSRPSKRRFRLSVPRGNPAH